MADLFQLISSGLPYDNLVKRIGGIVPIRRDSVLKLLGETKIIPSNNGADSNKVAGPFDASDDPSSDQSRRPSLIPQVVQNPKI